MNLRTDRRAVSSIPGDVVEGVQRFQSLKPRINALDRRLGIELDALEALFGTTQRNQGKTGDTRPKARLLRRSSTHERQQDQRKESRVEAFHDASNRTPDWPIHETPRLFLASIPSSWQWFYYGFIMIMYVP